MSDDELYRAYLAGDDAAGDTLMLRYARSLTAFISAYLHNTWDAEELMLECFSVIFVDRPAIAEGNFRAYLYRIARNMVVRLHKFRRKRQEFSLDEAMPAPDASPEDAAWREERGAILRRCLNRIPPQYREALYLVFDMDMSYAQAARVLGCSVKKVDHMLDNGKKRLRQELEKEGITRADI